jgi:uncharacterized protein YigE (DUF2233 family)
MARRSWLGLVLGAVAMAWSLARSAQAADPAGAAVTTFHGLAYRTFVLAPTTQDLRLYGDDGHGKMLGNFSALQRQVAASGGRLLFAANAGMFDPASKPVGLLVENGEEISPLNLKDGPGNFFLKPNGVFVINEHHHALIVESGDYPALVPPALWATQSGPLLLYGGNINPDFMPDSKNRKIRSGIGVTSPDHVIFALSKQPVTFYEFAELFLMKLHCRDALYLDGEISDFWSPGDLEKDGQHHFGPMFGLIAGTPQEGVTAPPATP